jgi:hypothetical protein
VPLILEFRRTAGMRLVPRAPELVLMPVDPLVRVQVSGCPAPKDGKKGPTAKSIARRATIYPVEKNAIPHYDRFCAGTAVDNSTANLRDNPTI